MPPPESSGSDPEGLSWRFRGRCLTYDPELFFPEPGEDASAPKAICWRCPVRVECLTWALQRDLQGVWGATGQTQRRKLQTRRKRTFCPVCASSLVVSTRYGGQVCIACGVSWKLPRAPKAPPVSVAA